MNQHTIQHPTQPTSLIHEPTHIQANSYSSIDLVFTDEPN